MDHLSKLMYRGEVIGAFTKTYPDLGLLKHDDLKQDHMLQEWILDNIKPQFHWMTGVSIIESANNIIEDAISNGNIK